jgi:hypothetical protein
VFPEIPDNIGIEGGVRRERFELKEVVQQEKSKHEHEAQHEGHKIIFSDG